MSTIYNVGDELPPLPLGELTRATITEYSRVSKDPNPMHTDDELAKEMGYPGVFAQGMLGMAYLARHVEAVAGVGKLRRIKVRFKTMTWPGEHITCRARVTSVERIEGRQRVTCDIHTENEEGQPKVVGTATFDA
jgi:acyl dehydratase